MTEYIPQEMDHIFMTNDPVMGESHTLLKIGPIWAIEHYYSPDETLYQYFDEDTAKEKWDKLKEARKEQIERTRKARNS
jgi:hypothetical protein